MATAAAASRPRCSSSSGTAATRGSRTRWSTSASTTTPTRSASCGASTGSTTTSSVRRPREEWITVDDALRAELESALDERATRASPTGRASRISRSASTARTRSTPSCSSACGSRHDREVLRLPARRPRRLRDSRPGAVAHDPLDTWDPGVRDQCLDCDRGRAAGDRRARRVDAGPRGALRRARRARYLHARRRDGRRPRRDGRPRGRPRRQARSRRAARDDGARGRGEARRGVLPVAVGALGRGAPLLADGGLGQGDRGSRGPSGRDTGQCGNALQPRVRERARRSLREGARLPPACGRAPGELRRIRPVGRRSRLDSR